MIKSNLLIYLLPLTFLSCDPTYPILMKNESNENIQVYFNSNEIVKANNNTIITDTINGKEYIVVQSKSELNLGIAIAELPNDITFDTLEILSENSRRIAEGKDEILNMFSQKNGKFKKPYTIIIE